LDFVDGHIDDNLEAKFSSFFFCGRFKRVALAVVSPLEVDCAPGESSTEGRQNDVITGIQFVLPIPQA
jgi:hypothetical protein